MSTASTGEKTEQATPQKLKELRKHGSVARSADAGMAAGTLALLLVLPALAARLFSSLEVTMRAAFHNSATMDPGQALGFFVEQAQGVAWACAPLLAVVAGAAILAQFAVTRSKPNPMVLRPRAERVSPKQGVKRVFSKQSLFEGGKGLAKIAIVGLAGYGVWMSSLTDIIAGSGTVAGFMRVMGSSVTDLLVRVALAALLVGAVDAWWSIRRFKKQSMMSKSDVKMEHKQSEGDPTFKAARRSRQLAMGRNRMIEAVGDADVVLVNPTHIAIALKYEPGMPAPKVVARGAGHVATRIRERALEAGVPLHRDVPTARALYTAAKVGAFIPTELYDAVAVVIAQVMAARPRR